MIKTCGDCIYFGVCYLADFMSFGREKIDAVSCEHFEVGE